MVFPYRVGVVVPFLVFELELVSPFSIWGGVRERVRLVPTGSPQLHCSINYKGLNGFFETRECRLRCAAVVLTVSEDNTQGGISSAPYSSAGSGERTVVGEVVLSGWLDELPVPSLSLPDLQKRDGEEGHLVIGSGPKTQRSGDRGEKADHYSYAPIRFQHLIQVNRV